MLVIRNKYKIYDIKQCIFMYLRKSFFVFDLVVKYTIYKQCCDMKIQKQKKRENQQIFNVKQ